MEEPIIGISGKWLKDNCTSSLDRLTDKMDFMDPRLGIVLLGLIHHRGSLSPAPTPYCQSMAQLQEIS